MGKNIKTSLSQFIKEQTNNVPLVEEIKNYLIGEDGFDYDNWKQYIDNQDMGECQMIVSFIISEFADRGVKKVFGEIEVDQPSITFDEEYDSDEDEYVDVEKENYLFTHHWVEIDGKIYDFSKGTLKDNIEWAELYDVSTEGEEWRYRPISN